MPQRQPPQIVAAPLGHTFINIHLSHNSRFYCANLRLGSTPRLIAYTKIRIIHRLDHARIRHIHQVRLNHAPIIRWNQTRIQLRLAGLAGLAGHKRRATKRCSNRQHRSNRSCDQGRLPRQTTKRLRRIRDTRSHPQHSNKRLHKSLSRPLQ